MGWTFQSFRKLISSAKELDESGLFSKKDNRFYDRFRGRVIFPIRNIKGDLLLWEEES